MKIVVTGAAGLVGQNLIVRLRDAGYEDVVAIDKHPHNIPVLQQLHPTLEVVKADLAHDEGWESCLAGADAMVLGHAQIGGLNQAEFTENNVLATEKLLAAAKRCEVGYLVHLSSSVVNSKADDFYVQTKKQQEQIVVESSIPCCVLRPTLMFGWFDRKHLGWLSRFMRKSPVFPIPGDGKYLRQPLFVQDFCSIILACLEQRPTDQRHNISGQQRIEYIDLIRELKRSTGAKSAIVKIPYRLFEWLLIAYSWIDCDPPFTVSQLEALVIPEEFEVIDWPAIFSVQSTPITSALDQTFNHPIYSAMALKF